MRGRAGAIRSALVRCGGCGYLPAQLSESDVRGFVRAAIAAGAADLGSVMKQVMPRAKGRFDGRELNRIVREELGS